MMWKKIEDELPPCSDEQLYMFWDGVYGFDFGWRRHIYQNKGVFDSVTGDLTPIRMYSYWQVLEPPEEGK